MKTKQLFYLSTVAIAFAFASCKKDDPAPTANGVPVIYDNGVFITNEGLYNNGTGTVNFYNRSTAKVYNDIFKLRNGYPLGNVVQSMQIYNHKGYIVVNNAGKVQVVNDSTFASSGIITGLTNPRYFIGINNTTGYISQWGSGATGEVKIINLNTNTITGTITTGNGAENMVRVGNNIYVACSGGYGNDSVVTVIDATTNTVITSINTGANPASLQVDANGKLWVLCGGQWNSLYTTLVKTGSLARIDVTTNTVDFSLPFTSTSSSPSHLVIDNTNTTLYYMYNSTVCSQSISSSTLNTSPIINRNFYSLGIDPATNYFYASDAGTFSSNGKVIRYNATGVVLDSFAAGIIPGNFCFK